MRFFEEIAHREDRNANQIVLYPEGLFYKAYDRSAFACVSRISTFKPSKKRIKYCAREMASIGFPAVALAKYFPAAPEPLSDGRIEITLEGDIDTDACETWKASLPLKERRPRGSSKAYLPTLGRGEKTGNLFVHPADLLPDTPALAAGTTGPKQPVQTTGGRGAVEQGDFRNDETKTDRSETTGPAMSCGESSEPTAADRRYGAETGFESPAKPEKTTWLRRLIRKIRPDTARETHGKTEGPGHWEMTGNGKLLLPTDYEAAIAMLRTGLAPEMATLADTVRTSDWQAATPQANALVTGAARTNGSTAAMPQANARLAGAADTCVAGRPDQVHPNPGQPTGDRSQPWRTALRNEGPALSGARRGSRDENRRETKEERVARLIREFRLEAATPVECLLFVADLKKEIDGYL
ncbi:hypothetical protein [uncultured Alistipes sp.]|uniref:hypothetical protein n=1 Tax=uncultured Alistipes sp. TaxID=538949 RepID=UPI00272B62EE|nr:hypothetical protein [uncultured Alistipes sp.]